MRGVRDYGLRAAAAPRPGGIGQDNSRKLQPFARMDRHQAQGVPRLHMRFAFPHFARA